MEEKSEAYEPLLIERPPRRRIAPFVKTVCASLLLLASLAWWLSHQRLQLHERHAKLDLSSTCLQVEPLVPSPHSVAEAFEAVLESNDFRNASAKRLSEIVQIPSISYDDLGEVGEDDRFDIFYKVDDFLEANFPRVHKHLEKQKVNTHGLLYTWKGTEDLKPSILMAHQDVVPVEQSTIDTWAFPPFSGHYDGKYVWGRGSSDCKNQLIAILEAVEGLIEYGFKPKRSLLLSFGFDEEVSGTRGAGRLAPKILETYGKDSIAAIVDEGGGWITKWGSTYAAPAVGEKGYTDVHITVRTPGGHSSVPSDHTSIGILSELITLIEKHRYSPYIADSNPILGSLQCGAKYSPSFPKKLKHLLAKRLRSKTASASPNLSQGCGSKHAVDELAEEAAAESLGTRYTIQTSQAVDLILGGAKVNALPEKVEAVVNHRVNIGEHPSIPQKRIARLAGHVAKKYNLTLNAYPSKGDKVTGKSITLTTSETTLEPAPSTPLDVLVPGTLDLSPWGVLSGTTRGLYAVDGKPVNMAPAITTGNTDTRYYWDLSRHIFRYNPGYDPLDEDAGLGNIHTVNERQSVTAHINSVKWFARWIQNVDDAKF